MSIGDSDFQPSSGVNALAAERRAGRSARRAEASGQTRPDTPYSKPAKLALWIGLAVASWVVILGGAYAIWRVLA